MSPTAPVSKVAIVGATGHIGEHFVEALLKTGKHTVTALTRAESKRTLPEGVKKVQISYDDHNSLVAALEGQQFLIVCLAVMAPPDTQIKLVKAAVEAGVSYIMPSLYGMDIRSPRILQDSQLDVIRQLLAEIESVKSLSYVCLACGIWYEWSLSLGEEWFGFQIKERKVTFVDDGMTVLTVSTWLQCGRAVAALVSLPESGTSPALSDWKNEPVYIDSFRISQRDMLDSLHRVLGTTDEDWEITYEPATKRVQDGMAEFAGGKRAGIAKNLYGKMFMRSREDGSTPEASNELLGLPKESLDEATKRAVEMAESGFVPRG